MVNCNLLLQKLDIPCSLLNNIITKLFWNLWWHRIHSYIHDFTIWISSSLIERIYRCSISEIWILHFVLGKSMCYYDIFKFSNFLLLGKNLVLPFKLRIIDCLHLLTILHTDIWCICLTLLNKSSPVILLAISIKYVQQWPNKKRHEWLLNKTFLSE